MTAPTAGPALQAAWIDALLGGPLPEEPHATCGSCAMLPPAGETYSPRGPWFNPSTRCCTYTPALASFLVGRLLADPDPALGEGRARVRARIAQRAGVSPLGVRPTWAERALYKPGSARFGHSPALLCPYYAEGPGGTCTIWRHRNGVCATWYCKHDRGAAGWRAWKALERLLLATERALARWCVLELDVGEAALAAVFQLRDGNGPDADTEDDVDAADEGAYRARWGRWFGREERFYEEAARLVTPLAWADVERIGGSEIAVLAALARAAVRALSDGLPASVVPGSVAIEAGADGYVRVTTHSRYDVLDLPRELFDLLPRLSAGGLEEAREALETEQGIALDDALVQRLVDFGVLLPSPTTGS